MIKLEVEVKLLPLSYQNQIEVREKVHSKFTHQVDAELQT